MILNGYSGMIHSSKCSKEVSLFTPIVYSIGTALPPVLGRKRQAVSILHFSEHEIGPGSTPNLF